MAAAATLDDWTEQRCAPGDLCVDEFLERFGGNEAKVPASLEEMTFDNYQTLLGHKDSWAYFEPLFGGTRARISANLKEVGAIRKNLFHFKREITSQDHDTLTVCRNWLLTKVKQARDDNHRDGAVNTPAGSRPVAAQLLSPPGRDG